ncbi:hypothetical protein HPY27_01475 [Brevibacillus sp. HB1.1]|uniref:hypothetical protein n=1 Tax=Brevibacillus sp. HB1.1 TaxID=2738808 RepID=UPI00157613DD|nr:hypothetical protein [Brevibacillus sp. HB1.1]NTU28831.1 hypothetical protein [Brevibacillus sp. HB1.1]
MAYFTFDVEIRTDETGPSGNPFIIFHLVASFMDPIRGEVLYPMTVKYTDGMILHNMNQLNKDFPHVQFRRDLITSMKQFVKSQVE